VGAETGVREGHVTCAHQAILTSVTVLEHQGQMRPFQDARLAAEESTAG
jgi:hypothetical protein